jgi:hypothetical protein
VTFSATVVGGPVLEECFSTLALCEGFEATIDPVLVVDTCHEVTDD